MQHTYNSQCHHVISGLNFVIFMKIKLFDLMRMSMHCTDNVTIIINCRVITIAFNRLTLPKFKIGWISKFK